MIILSLTVTLTLKTASQSFWKTIWLIMMQYYTMFGSKSFIDSEDIIGQTFIRLTRATHLHSLLIWT